jgi:riboflavin synthase
MFTGIVSKSGVVGHIQVCDNQMLIRVLCPNIARDFRLKAGDSVACNGICLTVTEYADDDFTVYLSSETLGKTTAKSWIVGTPVNLEPALKMGDELGGHLVSGHIDGVASIVSAEMINQSIALEIAPPPDLLKFIAVKGSVTIDGVSLTVNNVTQNVFSVNLIPHTWENTTLGNLKAGDSVNLEIDLIARYIARMMEFHA